MERMIKLSNFITDQIDKTLLERREQELHETQTKQPAGDVSSEVRVLSQAFAVTDDQNDYRPMPQMDLVFGLLRQDLPYSVPIYHRLQFFISKKEALSHENQNGNAHHDGNTVQETKLRPSAWVGVVADAAAAQTTSRPTTFQNGDLQKQTGSTDWDKISTILKPLLRSPKSSTEATYSQVEDETPWLVAYIDLTEPGQTNLYIYGNWEVSAPLSIWSITEQPDNPAEGPRSVSTATFRARRALLQQLFRYIWSDHLPLVPKEPDEQWKELDRGGKWLAKPYSPYHMILGTIAEVHWEYIRSLDPSCALNSHWKLIFPCTEPGDAEKPGNNNLPEGLRYGTLEESQLQNVLDQSPVPRTLKTLKQAPNVGVWTNDGSSMPISWGFLGKDNSVASLFVTPEYRGKGLAVKMAWELLKMHTGIVRRFDQDFRKSSNSEIAKEQIWCHADVNTGNAASRKAMEKAGGMIMWKDAWMRVDLSRMEGL